MSETMIRELKAQADAEWATVKALGEAARAASARHYDLLAQIDTLRGMPLDAEFHAALAACYRDEPGAEERKVVALAAFPSATEAA